MCLYHDTFPGFYLNASSHTSCRWVNWFSDSRVLNLEIETNMIINNYWHLQKNHAVWLVHLIAQICSFRRSNSSTMQGKGKQATRQSGSEQFKTFTESLEHARLSQASPGTAGSLTSNQISYFARKVARNTYFFVFGLSEHCVWPKKHGCHLTSICGCDVICDSYAVANDLPMRIHGLTCCMTSQPSFTESDKPHVIYDFLCF